MDEDIKYLMTLQDEELLEMLVPVEERHSPNSDVARGRYILNQCVSRSHDALVSFCKTHQGSISFTEDMVATLVPFLVPSIPAKIVILVAIIILKHGINKYI